ncbi:hypothetical protein LEP1GSC132_1333 [Leptospira kirschneri str. 200803703]|nr:hypothetical protein LEP1GSC044_0303 [Leptospira kirschneri serovar Grippotyphosa str. RM52]EKQ84906.1 hypothetical protein LEP1GSC064_2837 [Leptospira kirschneri serovar Grippotyphosa str. Moskva]EKR08607.1 hypothetical protein LEP1GSC122_1699 [Leptospira kirschneri serovar Valbuzzi str. 200702274]EMK18539.1 hypothetical protein LEP1GSC042_0461 [Leptospira kirschneri serovar Bim str. PUO 1247]EMN06177.1 hypothetical protein LEP1GSC046_2786 [Leptospira kirschneri serovar Bim str. 1051]EMN26
MLADFSTTFIVNDDLNYFLSLRNTLFKIPPKGYVEFLF